MFEDRKWDAVLQTAKLTIFTAIPKFASMPPLSKLSKVLLILLVLLAASEFVVRGPARFLRAADFNDFLSPYIQSKALLKGMDPYSPHVLAQLWPGGKAHQPSFVANDLDEGSLVARRGIPTAYPLSCLLLLAPLAVLPWPVAHVAWAIINVGLTLLLIWALLANARFQKTDCRAYVFVAFALALAPLQTGVATGSIAISTVALCGIALTRDQRSILTGVLFGLAICLKPQIGLPFLAYYLLRRHWRACGFAAAVVATAFMVAMTRLAMSGSPWLQNYQTDNKILLSTGILSDFTERNPIRFGLINLQVLFYAIFHHANAANASAAMISAVLFGIWIWLVLRSDSRDALLPMSALLILSLFPIYHRLYDAWILIFPLCWSLKQFAGEDRKFARAAFFLLLPFLVPGGSALEQLQANYQIPEAISQSWYWTAIVMPHQIWFLLLLSLLLLWRMAVLPLDIPAGRI
jgi:hypothetical protein